jgi:hypothetical protein
LRNRNKKNEGTGGAVGGSATWRVWKVRGGAAWEELRVWMVMRLAGARRGGKTRAGGADDTVGRAKRAKGVRRPGELHEIAGWDSA